MKSITKREIQRFSGKSFTSFFDNIIVEEPLELYINQNTSPYLVTMRTPGDDKSLIFGLLFSLGLITNESDVSSLKFIKEHKALIYLKHSFPSKSRPSLSFSSCGLCNSESWEEVNFHSIYPIFDQNFRVSSTFIAAIHANFASTGDDFALTGGNHKVVLISEIDPLILEAEDVGRHNAFDKVIGQCISAGLLPIQKHIAVLSGRCSFEMCQKSWLAGIPIIVSRGAPTSKAVQLAEDAGITLIGFARSDSFNVYTHPYRIENEE